MKAGTQTKTRTFLVRISGVPSDTQPRDLKHRLEAQVDDDLKEVIALPQGGFRAKCRSAETQDKILGLNGTMVAGKPI